MWMTSAGTRLSRSFAATSRTSSSEKYVIRLIQKPKDHRGGIAALPVSVVYSSRTCLGVPRKTNRSSSSSPRSRAFDPWYEAPMSNVAGAEVWANMP